MRDERKLKGGMRDGQELAGRGKREAGSSSFSWWHAGNLDYSKAGTEMDDDNAIG